MGKVLLEESVILHRRQFRDSSLILELFTKNYGRIAVVAKGARRPKSKKLGRYELFLPVLISWSGRGELKQLTQIEPAALPYRLSGKCLLCGFYLNELLMKLLHRDDPHPSVFELYQNAILHLEKGAQIEMGLRVFEKEFLECLGYGLPFIVEVATGEKIVAEDRYEYVPGLGFSRVAGQHKDSGGWESQRNPEAPELSQITPRLQDNAFKGKTLLAIACNDYQDSAVLQAAKRLFRQVLSFYLGGKELKTKALF